MGSGILMLGLAACSAAPGALPWSWQVFDTGSRASLRGIAVIDAHCVYVSGTDGTLLRTIDGGQSWQDVAPPQAGVCDFRDLEAFDGNTVLAMVAGQPAKVFRTADGGLSWGVVHHDDRPEAFFDAMARHGEEVVLFGDPLGGRFSLWRSKDAGQSWADMADQLPLAVAGEAGFAASGTCVAPRDDGGYSLVTGGGATRHVAFAVTESSAALPPIAALPLVHGDSAGAFSIAWAGDFGLVVGGDYRLAERRDGSGAISHDGGLGWRAVDVGGYRSAVVWLDEGMTALAVGPAGASVSCDRGQTWQLFGRSGFHALARGGDGAIWACGSDGRVAKLRRVP